MSFLNCNKHCRKPYRENDGAIRWFGMRRTPIRRPPFLPLPQQSLIEPITTKPRDRFVFLFFLYIPIFFSLFSLYIHSILLYKGIEKAVFAVCW